LAVLRNMLYVNKTNRTKMLLDKASFGWSTYWHSLFFVCFWRNSPPVGQGLVIHDVSRSHRRITVGRTSLDEWSARRRYLYLTIHNTYNRENPQFQQTSGHRPTP